MKPKAHFNVRTNRLITDCSELTGDGLSWYIQYHNVNQVVQSKTNFRWYEQCFFVCLFSS